MILKQNSLVVIFIKNTQLTVKNSRKDMIDASLQEEPGAVFMEAVKAIFMELDQERVHGNGSRRC